jgi:hypothetical protein
MITDRQFITGRLESSHQHALRMMAEILKETNPVAYQACINMHNPALEDWNLLRTVKSIILRRYLLTMPNYPIFLAVIYRLYATWKLHKITPKLKVGMRDVLQELLEFAHAENVNYHSDQIAIKYKNKRWAKLIDDLATDILYEIKDVTNEHIKPQPIESISIQQKLPRKIKKHNKRKWA